MVFDRVKEIIVEQLGAAAEQVLPEAKLIDDLKADSLDIVELIMDLENEYDLEIPDDDLPTIKTVQDIVAYIEKNQ